MKLCYGLPPQTDYQLNNQKKLAYTVAEITAPSFLIGPFVLAPIFYLFFLIYWPNKDIFGLIENNNIIQFVGIMLLSMIFHEGLHVLAFPKFGRDAESFLGFDQKSRLPYVAYNGIMRKWRFILVALAPFIVLAGGSLALAFILPNWRSQFIWSSIFNAASAAGDLYIVGLILIRVPHGSYIQREYFGDLGPN
jgi:hypothetical protein